MKPCLWMASGRLRPATRGDRDPLLALLHEPQVRRYLCDDKIMPRRGVIDMLERSAILDCQGLGLWAIEDEGGRFSGIAGLEPVSDEPGVAPQLVGGIEPIIAIHPDQWGIGLAQSAVTALIGHARDELRLSRLVAAVDVPNARSDRLMRRCGFAVIGTAPGPVHDLRLYELPLLAA